MWRLVTHLAKTRASARSDASGWVPAEAAMSAQASCSGDLARASRALIETLPRQEKVPITLAWDEQTRAYSMASRARELPVKEPCVQNKAILILAGIRRRKTSTS